jgi:cell division protein FtsA
LGGHIVTEDIKEGCMVMRDQAEKLKVKFGGALFPKNEINAIVSIPGLRGREPKEISVKNLTNIIQARMEEILEHVYNEIRTSGYENKLIGGIVITGGGARLKYLKHLSEYITGLDARVGIPTEHLINGRGEVNDPLYATGIGLAIKALSKPQPQVMVEEEITTTNTADTNEQNLVSENTNQETKQSWLNSVLRRSREWLEGDVKEFD